MVGEVATEGVVVEAGEQLLGPVVVDQTRFTVFVESFFLPPIMISDNVKGACGNGGRSV